MSRPAYKELELKLPTDYSEQDLRKHIQKKLHLGQFDYEIIRQSLDARRKPDVYWLVRVRVISPGIRGPVYEPEPRLVIPYKKREKRAMVVGSGPAGFFAALVLQMAGFRVTLFEKGPKAEQRHSDIMDFEAGGTFSAKSNYCHGEGGAGTFSDGKLTSRTKGIAPEKQFVFEQYVQAGAPEEILYLAKPHIGSDKLRQVIVNLRNTFVNAGGTVLFDTEVTDLKVINGKCTTVISTAGQHPCDLLIVAPGHSSYATYRMLGRLGIRFRSKAFAIGVRVEHPQELINRSQWQAPHLPGVKAAEYRLTHTAANGLPVYSFCMCPGGKVVPSAPSDRQNIVNGVSEYARNSPFANSAIVAGTNLAQILKHEPEMPEALDWLEKLEQQVFNLSNSYNVPGNRIEDFLNGKTSSRIPENSFPFQVFPFDFKTIFPNPILDALKEGLLNFGRKIRGFESGIMLGLESKTSAPVQVVRDEQRRCQGFENIFIAGEGSGYAGGITSSAVDGVKTALGIIRAGK